MFRGAELVPPHNGEHVSGGDGGRAAGVDCGFDRRGEIYNAVDTSEAPERARPRTLSGENVVGAVAY